jgi:hypothetical protein
MIVDNRTRIGPSGFTITYAGLAIPPRFQWIHAAVALRVSPEDLLGLLFRRRPVKHQPRHLLFENWTRPLQPPMSAAQCIRPK